MKTRRALLVGLAAASLAVSACSTNAAPAPWPDSTPSPVGATETVPAAAPAAQFVWENVNGQGHEAPRDATQYRAQFGLDPVPGIQIDHMKTAAPGDMVPCTIGPAVASGFLTAGHCAKDFHATQFLVGSPTGDLKLLGTAEPAQGPVDAAVIETDQVPASATVIARTWKVAGVLTLKGVRELVPVGSLVCFDGAVSGVRCGHREADDEDGLLMLSHTAQPGDSGAPVFVVDRATHNAALIGIVKSTDAVAAHATYLDTALLATDTAAKLDPGVTAFDGQPGQFSGRIAQ